MTPRSIQRRAPMPIKPRRSTATISASASAVGPISRPEPKTDPEQRRAHHRDQRDRKTRHLGRSPRLHIAVGGRVQHREAEAAVSQISSISTQLMRPSFSVKVSSRPTEVGGQTGHGSRRPARVQLRYRAFVRRTRRAGSRRCASSKTSRQIGAATAEPPPPLAPPCSTTVAQT